MIGELDQLPLRKIRGADRRGVACIPLVVALDGVVALSKARHVHLRLHVDQPDRVDRIRFQPLRGDGDLFLITPLVHDHRRPRSPFSRLVGFQGDLLIPCRHGEPGNEGKDDDQQRTYEPMSRLHVEPPQRNWHYPMPVDVSIDPWGPYTGTKESRGPICRRVCAPRRERKNLTEHPTCREPRSGTGKSCFISGDVAAQAEPVNQRRQFRWKLRKGK